ncbi:DNA cytosine methyltransferase [Azospirillum melinis]
MIRCVDFFCGVGGLTHGLELAGISVVAGIDVDSHCTYAYEANNKAKFILSDVGAISSDDIKSMLSDGEFTMLAGCAPCQPFSTYTRGGERKKNDWPLLYAFLNHVRNVSPDFVTMENVPGIAKHTVYGDFVHGLTELGYHVTRVDSAYCPDFGIPQHRKRLLLLASKHAAVPKPQATHDATCYLTVRQAIGGLPRIDAGKAYPKDRLHVAAGLSETNLERIKVSKPGGTWRDWPEELVAPCHRKETGTTYPSVYGRMSWDKPAPTITTQFHGFGNGRFGHPEQNRAISIREGAILQTFPKDYKFVKKGEKILFDRLGRQIGNAVPVRLGEVLGRSFVQHAKAITENY